VPAAKACCQSIPAPGGPNYGERAALRARTR